MKTPREILFQQHQSAQRKLDTVRQNALASVAPAGAPRGEGVQTWLLQTLLSIRWHLTGLSAAWILVALLNVDSSPSPVAAIDKERIPSPRQLLMTLRENRRQIAALIDPWDIVLEPLPAAPSSLDRKRRGQIRSTNSVA